jgi:hypothetical protein
LPKATTNTAVVQSDRYACPVTETHAGLICIGSSSTIGGRAHFADGREIQFNQVTGGDGNSYQDYDSSQHSFNWFEYLNAVSPSERFDFSTSVEYQLSDTMSLYSDVMYSNRNSRQIVTPRGIRANEVSADFIYKPTGEDITLERRRMVELGLNYFYQDIEQPRPS